LFGLFALFVCFDVIHPSITLFLFNGLLLYWLTYFVIICFVELLTDPFLKVLSGVSASTVLKSSNVHGDGKIQRLTNAGRALKFIESQGINVVNCRPERMSYSFSSSCDLMFEHINAKF
jgi:hypothetical protein